MLSLSLITSNTAGQTKKMITSATICAFSSASLASVAPSPNDVLGADAFPSPYRLTGLGACVGNIAGPFFYKSDQAPSYRLGIGSMLVSNCLEVLVILALRLTFIHANKKRDAQLAEMGVGDGKSESVPHVNETTFSDLTDVQNPKYVLLWVAEGERWC